MRPGPVMTANGGAGRVARKGVKWALFALTLTIGLHVMLVALPGIQHSAAALRSANLWLVGPAVVAEIAANAALAQVYRRSLAALGEDITYRHALRISMGMFTVGRVLPGGGAAAAVWGARRFTDHGVEAATATVAVVLAGTLGMATLGVIVFAGSAASLARGDVSPAYAAAIAVVLVVLASMCGAAWKAIRSAAFREHLFQLVNRVLHKVRIRLDVEAWREAADSMASVLTRKQHVGSIVCWSAANWLGDVLALWLLFLAFGYKMHVGVLLVGYGVANLLVAIPLTPGGLGVVEAGLAGTYAAFGVPGGVAVVAVLGYRLVSYWLPVLAGVPPYLGAGKGMAIARGA